MDTDNPSFGQWVRQRRQALHLTQQQLAALSSCAAETIRKIESDLRSPSPKIALLIAQALQLRPNVHQTFVRWARGDLTYVPALLNDSAPRVALSYGDPQVELRVGNLPFTTSSLVGRDLDLSTLQRILVQGRIRLITLTGPGGVGKTRLALAAAEAQRASFPDGCYFVPLAPITDPDLVLSTIAKTIDVNEIPGQPLWLTLQTFLRDKVMLLVLDNFEHVLAACTDVVNLLQGASRLTILATSRIPLHLQGEHEYEVHPLAVPARTEADHATLLQYDAVRLFIERAQAIKGNFHFANGQTAAIADICARLDGLPLAIELAAARVKILEPKALLQRLDRRLPMLTGGANDLPDRHRTLRATIDWSYNLLEPEEQTLFARLAVFAGGCSLEAIEEVCNAAADLSLPVLDLVQSLVNKSMLQQVHDQQGEPRFEMLETIYEYARERLTECHNQNDVANQHAMYYLRLAEAAERKLTSTGQQAQLQFLEAEHENFRTALHWLLQQEQRETALYLCNALARFWWIRGYLQEGYDWLEQVLDTDEVMSEGLRARALYWVGILTIQWGNYTAAEQKLSTSLALSQQASDQYTEGLALNALGIVTNAQGHPERAQIWYEKGIDLYRSLNNQERVATLLNNLGYTRLMQQAYEQATTLLEESLHLSRELGDEEGIAFALNNLGLVALWTNDLAHAQSTLSESLARFWELRDQRNCAEVLEGLAALAAAEGKPGRAATLLAASQELRTMIATVRTAYQQQHYVATLATIRSQLDTPNLTLALDAGKAMTLEQATRYALDAAD